MFHHLIIHQNHQILISHHLMFHFNHHHCHQRITNMVRIILEEEPIIIMNKIFNIIENKTTQHHLHLILLINLITLTLTTLPSNLVLHNNNQLTLLPHPILSISILPLSLPLSTLMTSSKFINKNKNNIYIVSKHFLIILKSTTQIKENILDKF